MLNEHSRVQLHKLIQQFGHSLCEDSRRCEAMLRDVCPNDKRETHLLISALKERAVADLLHDSGLPLSAKIPQLAQRLHNNLGITEEFALWSIESWAFSLGLIEKTSPPKTSTFILPKMSSLNRLTASVAKFFKPENTFLNAVKAIEKIKPPTFFHDAFQDEKVAIKLVRIKGGTFKMGSPEDENGRYSIEREHEATVNDFILGQYPVTFAEYDLFVKAIHGRKPSDNGWGRGLRPVINVSWFEALHYAAWLSKQTGYTYRLPTEAEWEFACRAGTFTPFSTGDFISTEQANFNGSLDYDSKIIGQQRKQTTEVGNFAANPLGLYDMHGNVWEWTASAYSENYNGEELRAFDETIETYRVLRGGSWVNTQRSVRSASRIRRDANDHADFIGFRLARDINQ